MAGSNSAANDAMIRRLESELSDKTNFANEVVSRAQNAERDLNEEDKTLLVEARGRMEVIKEQLKTIEDVSRSAYETSSRARQVGDAIDQMRGRPRVGTVEYRTAGAWATDMYASAIGKREATERLEMYYRAADHQKTGDTPGTVPDPIVGEVINFIDAARPLVSVLGPRAMPSATWHRPHVTQHTSVQLQGAGNAAAEKTELTSQKMTIERISANAATYGGYVNVSRQDIDFGQPSGLDLVIEDLAAQYAVETEAATGAAFAAVNTTPVTYDLSPVSGTVQDSVAAAIWSGVAKVYAATKNKGRVFITVSPDVLELFGPLFAPYGPFNQQGTGFMANNFSQGIVGTISGVPTVMSAGLGDGEAFVASTAAIEVYEQRVGSLQVIEPSVLGVQVAYAGYFTPLTIVAAGIVPLEAAS